MRLTFKILSLVALLTLTGFSVGTSQSDEESFVTRTPDSNQLVGLGNKTFDAGTGYCDDGNSTCSMTSGHSV
jgi:hypothetical protein